MRAVGEEGWREDRRGRILAAAGRVVAARSFDHASTDATAQAARVGGPTLCRYFPGKDALFSAGRAAALNELEARLDCAHGPVARDVHRDAAPRAEPAPLDPDRRNGELRPLPGASA